MEAQLGEGELGRLPREAGCCVGPTHLLVARDASIDCRINDSIQAHAEQVDIAVHLLVLVLANQGPQLLVFVLHNLDGILQGAHLHLGHTPHGVNTGTRTIPPSSQSCDAAFLPVSVDLTPQALSNFLC